ncbi:unnamed protein product [Symbiodinium natans]|uniref:Uncharacterized protein n=1 Tax=Symbiodinium natans TaxID=878477 RepID=A0A812V749_9DINO|nr:unnamed protein product [Symbiodinium natans]
MFLTGRSSRVSLSPHINPDAHHPDANARATKVCILGTCLPRMCPVQFHWAAAFDFQDGTVLIAELTAVNGRGEAWNENNYRIRDIRSLEGVQDFGEFQRREKYRQLWHRDIPPIMTSPDELHRKCSENHMNGEYYDLFFNNCQKWVATLLRDGYGIGESYLPGRCGKDCQACLLVSVVSVILYLLFVFVYGVFSEKHRPEDPIAFLIYVVSLPAASCLAFCAYHKCRNRTRQ